MKPAKNKHHIIQHKHQIFDIVMFLENLLLIKFVQSINWNFDIISRYDSLLRNDINFNKMISSKFSEVSNKEADKVKSIWG